MQGNEFLIFLMKWEITRDNYKTIIDNFDSDTLDKFLEDWSSIHNKSSLFEYFWYSNDLPVIPTSGSPYINANIIVNNSLYNDKQVIQDPIDATLFTPPHYKNNLKVFLENLKSSLKIVFDVEPLFRENLIELIPSNFILSFFNISLKYELEKDWIENESLKYIESRIKWKVYKDSNILAMQIGDLDYEPIHMYSPFSKLVQIEDNGKMIHRGIIPNNIEDIPDEEIQNWVNLEIHNNSCAVANKINKNIFLSELLSATITTNEALTFEFLKRKNEHIYQKNCENKISIKKIPLLGKVKEEKFLEFRSNELTSFINFRKEWNEGKGLFSGDLEPSTWLDNLNENLDKCQKELNSINNTLLKKIVENTIWGGLGVAAGYIVGASITPSLVMGLISSLKDIRKDIPSCLRHRQNVKATTPYFLLNIIDRGTGLERSSCPKDLSEKMNLTDELRKSLASKLVGMPITYPDLPQLKENDMID